MIQLLRFLLRNWLKFNSSPSNHFVLWYMDLSSTSLTTFPTDWTSHISMLSAGCACSYLEVYCFKTERVRQDVSSADILPLAHIVSFSNNTIFFYNATIVRIIHLSYWLSYAEFYPIITKIVSKERWNIREGWEYKK